MQNDMVICRPTVIKKQQNNQAQTIFRLYDSVHPCVKKTGINFIPNNIIFENNQNGFLITGPNMGGKSTLLRQTCICTIMAQTGSFVPASKFEFTPVDRIFTRIGASDRLMEGASTFFVEMEETQTILQNATVNSLVIVDELGRGTSTYDGLSIAYSVLKYLMETIKCRTLFSTHYHLLNEDFKIYNNIQSFFMDYEQLDNDSIRFLYKFVPGCIPKSFGIIVAQQADLPEKVISIAKEKAELMTIENQLLAENLEINKNFNSIVLFCSGNQINDNEQDEQEFNIQLQNLIDDLSKNAISLNENDELDN